MKFLGLYVLPACIVLLSCHHQKDLVNDKRPGGGKSPKHLMEHLRFGEFNCHSISLKSAVDINIDGNKNSFKAYLRLRKDSAIWISITPMLGIEMARILITVDSVKIINRSESTYFLGNYDYLSQMFDADINFDILQALILGNSVGLDEMDKVKSSVDRGYYLLSSYKKRKLKKVIEKTAKRDDLIYSNWLDARNYRVAKFLIYDFAQKQSLLAEFDNLQDFQGGKLPLSSHINIKSGKTVVINLEYSRVNVNKSLDFPFNIPSKYVPFDGVRKGN